MRTGRPRSIVARVTAGAAVALIATLVVSGCGNDHNGNDHGGNDHGGEHTDEHSDEAAAPAPANLAFVDIGATEAVLDQMTPAVAQFFNYDFQGFDEHVAQIRTDFTPEFWTEMEPGLEVVREVAQAKEVTSSAEVVGASVRSVQGGTAELLLFVNRTTTEEGGEPQSTISSVILTAAQVGPEWKIDGMRVR